MLQMMQKGYLAGFFIAMLVLAAFSLILTDWTGSFRGGTGSANVAEYDGGRITQNEFARLVSRVLQSERMDAAQAYDMGLIHQLLSSEIWQRLLFAQAGAWGVRVNDEALLTKIRDLASSAGGDAGRTPAQVIRDYLQAQGISEAEFLEALRQDMVNGTVRQALMGNAQPSNYVLNDVIASEYQTRDIAYVLWRHDTVSGVGAPDEAALNTYYLERQKDFMIPEQRDVTVYTLPRSVVTSDVTVTDDDARAFYDRHQDQFTLAAGRALAIVTFPSQKEAQDFLTQHSQDFVAAATKANLPVVQDQFTNNDALPAHLKPAMTAAMGAILDPVQTPLGWQVIQVGADNPAQLEPFDTVKKEIIDEIKKDRLGQKIDGLLSTWQETIEVGEDITTLPFYGQLNKQNYSRLQADHLTSENNKSPLAALQQDAGPLLKATFDPEASIDQMHGPFELPSGDMAMIQVTNITPAAPKSLASVRETLIRDWQRDTRRQKNMESAQGFLPDIVAGTTGLDQLAAERGAKVLFIAQAKRGDEKLPDSVDRAAWTQIFSTPKGQVRMIQVPEGILFARVDQARLADLATLAPEKTKEAKDVLVRAQANEQVTLFMNALNDKANPQVNERLLRVMFKRGE